LKRRWLAVIPVSLTLLLVFIIFVPVIQLNGMCAKGSGCVNIVQYDSISLVFGGWGVGVQRGAINLVHVGFYICGGFGKCPPTSGPYVSFWTGVGLLALADLVSVVLIAGRKSRSS